MRNRLLVVDGEPRGLRVLDVSLRGAGFEVDTASDGLQAWARLEKDLPDLVVCDAELPGLDGFELCTRLRGTPAGARLPFLMTSARKSRDQKIRALEAGADDFLAKPAYIKEVLARVRALLHRRDREALFVDGSTGPDKNPPDTSGRLGSSPFTGDLADISVVDLVQLIEDNGRSGIVHLRRPDGGPAFLYFRGGKVVDAEAGRLSGLDALSRLFSWTAGTFEIEWKNIRRKDVIERPPSELVFEGMQRLDAWNELRGQLGDPDAVFEVDYRLLAEHLAEIPDEVNGILRLFDGTRTVMQVVEESTMPDTEAMTALLRLRAEGIVYDRAAPRSGEAASAAPRLDGPLGTASSPFPAGSSQPLVRSGAAPRPVEESSVGRVEEEIHAAAPPPASPRRTAPGLGQRAALGEPAAREAVPAPRTSRATEQDNVIPFPSPSLSSERASAVSAPPHPDPTRVGFEPAAPTSELAAPAPAAETELVTPPAVPPHPAMTLPLGLAQEAGLARDRLLRDLTTTGRGDDAGAPGIPTLSAAMTDTQRGVGAAVPPARQEPSSVTHASAVPVEILDSPSGASKRSGRVSGPRSAGAGSLGDPSPRSGRMRISSDEPVAASGVVANETSAPVSAPRVGSGPRSVPRPGDSTVRVSFSDGAISRRDALDELGLPSRGRGLRVLAGALAFGVLAAVGVTRFLGSRAHVDDAIEQPHVAAGATPPARAPGAGRPSEAVVVPTAPPAPTPADPEIELPAAAPPAPPVAVKATPSAAADPDVAPPAPARAPEAERAATHAPVNVELPATGNSNPVSPIAAPPGAAAPPAPAVKTVPGAPEATSPEAASLRQLADCRTAFAKNRLREAIAACTAAAAANPRSAEALTMLAHTELNRGHLERANELAVRAVAIDPTLADAYVIIGGVHQDSGENKEAKAAYRRYLELSPRGRYADELRSIVNGL